MGKLAAAIEKNTNRPGGTCSVATVRAALPKADTADLDAALAALHVPATAIARGLSEVSGEKVGPSAVARHRRGDCACPR